MYRLLNAIVLLIALFGPFSWALIPSIKSFRTSSDTFKLKAGARIIVDGSCANFKKSGPSLMEFAQTFRSDLAWLTKLDFPNVVSGRHPGPSTPGPTIFLTLGADEKAHTLNNGLSSDEGYDFEISAKLYVIKGVAPIGAWWGTRTLLQQIATSLNDKDMVSMPIAGGRGSDTPGWEVRGFMIDAGRRWFETSFLADLCIYASFFKIQTMHLHASDNLWNPSFMYGKDWQKLYAAFRFQPTHNSPISGLVRRTNETWTRDEFKALQSTCSNHGVTIIPEIDTPGHSLVISKWKPELMIPGKPDNLNLSHPDTIPTIKSIWNEVLPWFDAKEISIGADEYEASLANVYISFVNYMATYITLQSGKSIRIWGTNEPSKTLSISKSVTIQHWNFPGDSIPERLMKQGYKVINSEQYFLYLDGKTSDGGRFPVELSQDLMWSGAPGGKGWAPNIFSAQDASNNTTPDNPNLRGSIMALWNDWGNNATTPLEIYYQLSRSLAVFGEKSWAGSGVRDTELKREDFDRIYPVLNNAAPGQNLNRRVKVTHDSVVFQYHSVANPLRTGIDSAGPPYTLRFTVKPISNTGVLFSGRDSKLHFDSLTFEDPSTRILYPLGVTLPKGIATTVEIHATTQNTYAIIDGQKHWWTTKLDIWGMYMKEANMSFAAPSSSIGSQEFSGLITDIVLKTGE